MARGRLLMPLLGLCTAMLGCGGNGHTTEKNFVARTDVEREARTRIRYWVDAATDLLDDSMVSADDRAHLQAAIGSTRAALSTYNLVRDRGATRGAIRCSTPAADSGSRSLRPWRWPRPDSSASTPMSTASRTPTGNSRAGDARPAWTCVWAAIMNGRTMSVTTSGPGEPPCRSSIRLYGRALSVIGARPRSSPRRQASARSFS